MSTNNVRNELGPYKATKMWNDIVRVFRTGMPISRHWKQFKSYDDCFVASEAVDWLLDYLQLHHNYGVDITRTQVIKLLKKFHRHNYIEDVRGSKYNSEEFEENSRLFRFVALSPIKTPQWPKQPLTTNNTRSPTGKEPLKEVRARINFKEQSGYDGKIPSRKPRETMFDKENSTPQHHTEVLRRPHCVKQLWKDNVLKRLSRVLSVDNISLLVNTTTWRTEHVKHNMTVLHKNGYVTGLLKNDLPPCWVISAMRFLSRWPDKDNESFPEYPGFEKDVFIMIKDYFDALKQPLTTYELNTALFHIYNKVHTSQPSPIEPCQDPGTAYPVLVVYDTPVKAHAYDWLSQERKIHSEPWRLSSYNISDSYRYAVDQSKKMNYKNHLEKHNQNQRYSRKAANRADLQRAKSLSDLVSAPRVETAFVGDGAYTVYYGLERRESTKDLRFCDRVNSAYHLNEQETATAPPPRYSSRIQRRSAINGKDDNTTQTHTLTNAKSEISIILDRIQETHRKSAYPKLGLGDRNKGLSAHNVCSTPSASKNTPPPSDVFGRRDERMLIEAFQHVLLFLPPANRRILHMMLKLMNKLSHNHVLVLSSKMNNRDLVLSSLCRCIIRSENEPDLEDPTSVAICEFLMEHFEEILTVPSDLRQSITSQVEALESSSTKLPPNPTVLSAACRVDRKSETAYCERITNEQYVHQATAELQNAMSQLLSDIINDKKMSTKEKKLKLKQFQRTYPETFLARFPDAESLEKVLVDPSVTKQPKLMPALLSNTKDLLKRLR